MDNGNESAEGTLPDRRDSDRDGKADGREHRDRDGLSNAGEDLTAMDPTDRESDNDGVRDGLENAGVVLSLRQEMLTVRLPRGGKLSGSIDGDATILCVTEDGEEAGPTSTSTTPSRR